MIYNRTERKRGDRKEKMKGRRGRKDGRKDDDREKERRVFYRTEGRERAEGEEQEHEKTQLKEVC